MQLFTSTKIFTFTAELDGENKQNSWATVMFPSSEFFTSNFSIGNNYTKKILFFFFLIQVLLPQNS